jgi:adenosine deaminase
MEFDLKDFKRICQNSLECSLLSSEEKENALTVWRKQWDLFIKEINK